MRGRMVVPPDCGRVMLEYPPGLPRGVGVSLARGLSHTLVALIAVGVLVGLARETEAAWPHSPGVNVPLCTAASHQLNPTIVSDGAGGAVVTWWDARTGNFDIYAQHVLASGAVDGAWPANGRALCTAASFQQYPTIVTDGAGGA